LYGWENLGGFWDFFFLNKPSKLKKFSIRGEGLTPKPLPEYASDENLISAPTFQEFSCTSPFLRPET